ncbi:unnamed protein product [Sympodiomycopsis kandeliae]
MSFQYRRSTSPVPSSSSSEVSSASSESEESDPLSSFLNPQKLPQVIPDLRFEQSYIASIRGFIHELEPEEAEDEKREAIELSEKETPNDGKTSRPPAIVEARSPKGEPELWIGRLRIDWLPLLKATIRDQFLSPMIQGALWGIVGLFLNQLRDSTRTYFRELRERRQLARAAASTAPSQLMKGTSLTNVGLRAGQIVGNSETH